MTKARILANLISDNAELADGQISVAEVVGAAPLASPTFTGTTTVSGDFNAFNDNGGSAIYDFKSDHYSQIQLTSDVDNSSSGGPYTVQIVANGNNGGLELRTNAVQYMGIEQSGNVTFNEYSHDADFRVESDSQTHMLFVDAGNDQVVVGDNGNYFSKFTVVGGKTRSTGIPLNQLSVYDNSAMASSTGGAITLWGNYTTNGAQAEGASIEAYKSNGTSGNYQYGMWLKTRTHGGSMDDRLFMDQAQTVFNETGASTDFRVESDGNTHMLFVDAGINRVGINEGNPVGLLDIRGTNSNTALVLRSGDNNIGAQGGVQVALGYDESANYAHSIRTRHDGTSNINNAIDFYTWNAGTDGASDFGSARGLSVTTDGVFTNLDSENRDFVARSDNNSNMFIVDAGLDRVKVGGNAVSTGMVSIQKDVNEDTNIASTPSLVFRNRSLASGENNIGGGIFFDTFRDVQDPCITAGIWFNKQPTGGVANHADIILGTSTSYGNNTNKPSERLRIIADGDVRLGVGNGSNTVGPAFFGGNLSSGQNGFGIWPEADGSSAVKLFSSVNNTAGRIHFRFSNPNGTVGQITTSGSSTSYATSSDYRLKTDAQPMTGASARVQALNPVNFEWIADGTRVDGFLAHEAQAIVPEAVTGTKDAVDADGNPEYQGIDQSKLVPLLTAALQEAITKIETLEARIAALENA
jgi:hypothetical protein